MLDVLDCWTLGRLQKKHLNKLSSSLIDVRRGEETRSHLTED